LKSDNKVDMGKRCWT